MVERKMRGLWLRRTSRRLSVQYSLLYIGLVLVIFLFAYFVSRYEIRDWAKDLMRDDAASLQVVLDEGDLDSLRVSVDALSRLSADRTRIFGLFDEAGNAISGKLASVPDVRSRTHVSLRELGLPPDPSGEVDGYWVQIDQIGPWTLIQGISDEVIYELLEALVAALAVGFVSLFALGLLLGSRVGRLTEDRVATISDVLGRASSGDLSARIAAKDPASDDLGQVETRIDDALGQIESLVAAQRQITVDVAHDLRSPLQRLRQRLERLTPTPRFDDDKAAGLAAIDQIERTFNALLTIADLEHGHASFDLVAVPVGPMLDDLRDLYEESAELAGLTFDVLFSEPDVAILGNRNLLLQMLGNLVENAIKYCPRGARVMVSATSADRQVNLRVRDNGPGMKEGFLPHACDRFSREDPSRHIPGNGLGLAMVRAIANGHGATVSLQNLDPGLCVTVSGLSSAGLNEAALSEGRIAR